MIARRPNQRISAPGSNGEVHGVGLELCARHLSHSHGRYQLLVAVLASPQAVLFPGHLVC